MCLLDCLLVSLLQSLHLLLLLMTSMNGLPHGATYRATDVFASMVVAEHIPRTNTVWDQALLVFAFSNMLPQSLHPCTVRSNGASSIFVLTLRGMS